MHSVLEGPVLVGAVTLADQVAQKNLFQTDLTQIAFFLHC